MKTRKPTRLSSWQSHLKTQGQSQKCNSETRWRHTAATLLVVTFGTYRRRRRDVIMGRHGYIPLRRFSDVPLRVVGCFIWDLSETSWRRLIGRDCCVLLRRRHNVPIRRRIGVPLRRLADVPPRRPCVFHLGRTCHVTRTYREASLRRRHDVLLSFG